MKILCGLGNPGKKYLFTRHNLGFMLIDFIAGREAAGSGNWRKKHQCLIQEITIGRQRVLLLKPQTFMNLSGKAVREVINFYKTPLEDLLIIQDDKDQPFGQLKFQRARGDGGHRGIQDIHRELGSKDYCRLKMGIAPSCLTKEQSLLSKPKSTYQGTKEVAQVEVTKALLTDALPEKSPSSISANITETSVTKTNITETSIAKKGGTAQFVLSVFEKEEQKNLQPFLKRGKEALFCFIEKGFSLAATRFNSKI